MEQTLRPFRLVLTKALFNCLQRYEEEFASLMTTFKLAKLIVITSVIGHWLSCLFFGLGSITHDMAADAGLNLGVTPPPPRVVKLSSCMVLLLAR